MCKFVNIANTKAKQFLRPFSHIPIIPNTKNKIKYAKIHHDFHRAYLWKKNTRQTVQEKHWPQDQYHPSFPHCRKKKIVVVFHLIGGGNGNPFQYSCLKNPMDRVAWGAIVQNGPRIRHDWTTKHIPFDAEEVTSSI